jgi:xanthine/uracil permease
MPLTPSNVTIASRVMLPAHTLLSLGIGLAWAFQSDHRTNNANLAVLRQWPIAATGTILVVLAASVAAGMLSRRRVLAAVALIMGGLVYLFLAGTILAAAFHHPASWSAFLWPLYVATAHFASALSLAHDEVTDAEGNHRRAAA